MKIPMPQTLRRRINIWQLKRDKNYVIPDCCKLDAAGHVDMMLCWSITNGYIKNGADCFGCEFCREVK